MKNDLYQTIIYEAKNLDTLTSKLTVFKEELSDNGNMFIITDNIYENNTIQNSFFDVIENALECDFKHINTIVFPVLSSNKHLKHNINYLLWFVKDYNKMYFQKDNIREKHIWKDVEWGKRTKNYNEKGKDPSNVWIPTIDDGKGKITEHIILSPEEIINRCIVSTSKEKENILIEAYSSLDKSKLIKDRKIEFKTYDMEEQCQNEVESVNKQVKNINNFSGANVYFKSSEVMNEIEDNTVSLMVTSPPYWDLKNYFKKGQIGQESYEEYLDRLNKIWKETYRVLKNDGSMWININTRTKNKKPILIPNDIIKECKKMGFKLKDIIIWHKSSGIPTHKNNLVDKYEYFLWFIKDDNFSFNSQNISQISEYKNEELNNGLIWNINRKAGSVGKDFIHPAIYPTALIDRVIRLITNENDIVLDPFLGSGTSMISALKNKRNFIGYEYNENFQDLMKFRVSKEKLDTDLVNFNTKETENNNKVFRKE
ncbi:DNA methyltransferase [Sulfurimonas sp. CS5]|jgi:DNA modification methylase|uniref:DNA methyltransferase n=1 Tax=Sulfurimonas sp. CS5 TaxID=3391145 RepID=UPI0039E8EE5F